MGVTELDRAKDSVARGVDTLQRVLAEIGWAPEGHEPCLSYRVDLGSPDVPLAHVVLEIDPDAEYFTFFVAFSGDVPDELRDAVARYIIRANWDLSIGNFQMDYDSGAVRFRSTVDFAGGKLADTTIRRAILTAMEIVEAHFEALSAVMQGRAGA